MDQAIDHFATSRFGSGSQTFLTFQNNTIINSTLVFCRATADEFNYSSNPTYKNSEGVILGLDSGEPFSFITTVGLYNDTNELLSVAKLSKPLVKDFTKEALIRVKLDF